MDRKQQNDVLTRVGPGTPMGELMRQYWLPAVMSSELIADGDPVRLRLLGEDLIAFRTTSGAVAVMDHRCPHRCASLFYGRNEEDGIRCIYHGWKYSADGVCVEMPNIEGGLAGRGAIRARAYRTAERAGVVWVYMGPRREPPPIPEFPVLGMSDEDIDVYCIQRQCNYLQTLEGEIDTSHAMFLHFGMVGAENDQGPVGAQPVDLVSRAVRYKTAETPYGLLAGAHKKVDEENTYWRFANFLFPFWTQIPPCQFGAEAFARAWVPMDDTHTMLFSISTDTYFGLGSRGKKKRRPVPGPPGITFDYEFLPNTTDWYGRWRLAANGRNDYFIDRALQRSSIYSGVDGLEIQDSLVSESMGPITDHTLEHLTPADQPIVQTRRALLKAALALRDEGIVPPGVDEPAAYGQWSGFMTARSDVDWRTLYDESVRKIAATGAVE